MGIRSTPWSPGSGRISSIPTCSRGSPTRRSRRGVTCARRSPRSGTTITPSDSRRRTCIEARPGHTRSSTSSTPATRTIPAPPHSACRAASSDRNHDHSVGFTSQNVYRGKAGTYSLFNEFDTGDENDPSPSAFRLPSGEFDMPLVFHDRVFDSHGIGFFDLFNLDGILGDKFTVNGKIQPFKRVARRKYRFRMHNIGPSRWYQFEGPML